MQKYAKYSPPLVERTLYTFYLYSTSSVVFTKKNKKKKEKITFT